MLVVQLEEVLALPFLDNCSCLVTWLESQVLHSHLLFTPLYHTNFIDTNTIKWSLQCISSKRLSSSPLLPPPSQTLAPPPLSAVHPGLLELAARELAFVETRRFNTLLAVTILTNTEQHIPLRYRVYVWRVFLLCSTSNHRTCRPPPRLLHSIYLHWSSSNACLLFAKPQVRLR
jgi:hypothetical protein